jgi:HEPN domain-containing protein
VKPEWVGKAEGDFHSCLREVRARRHPNPDSACFHSQQCAEKYLQARLQEAGLAFPKTHDLPTCSTACSPSSQPERR